MAEDSSCATLAVPCTCPSRKVEEKVLETRFHVRADENESPRDLPESSSKNENFLRNCIGEEDEKKDALVSSVSQVKRKF